MGPIMGGLIGSGLVAPAAAAVVVPLWLTMVYGVARSSYHYAVKRRERKLLDVIENLAALARELIGERVELPAPL
jgi:hypothetical protein